MENSEVKVSSQPHKITVHEYGDFEIRTKTKHLIVSRTCVAKISLFYKTYFDQYPDHKYTEIDESDEDIEILQTILSDTIKLIRLAGNPLESNLSICLNNSKLFRILYMINKIDCDLEYTSQFILGYIIEWGLYNIYNYSHEMLYVNVENSIVEEKVPVLPEPLTIKTEPIMMPYSEIFHNKLKILADIYNIVPLDKIIQIAHTVLHNGRQNLMKYTKQQQTFVMDKIKQLLETSENKKFTQHIAANLLGSYMYMNITNGFITTVVNRN